MLTRVGINLVAPTRTRSRVVLVKHCYPMIYYYSEITAAAANINLMVLFFSLLYRFAIHIRISYLVRSNISQRVPDCHNVVIVSGRDFVVVLEILLVRFRDIFEPKMFHCSRRRVCREAENAVSVSMPSRHT